MSKLQITQKQHLILEQNALEKEYYAKFNEGKYTLAAPLVIVNPYKIAPLTALIMFRTDTDCEITLTVKGKERRGDVTHTFAAAKEHILPVYGLYSGCTTQVELLSSTGAKHELQITTEVATDEQLPKLLAVKEEEAYLASQWIFLTPTSKHYPLACDYRGDIRWYIRTNLSFDLKRLRNGNLLVGTDRLVQKPYYVSGCFEMSPVGKIFKEYRVPGGYHHDTYELKDGNLLFLSQDYNAATVEDVLVLLDRKSGELIRKYDFKDYFPKKHSGSGTYSAEDWCHSNSVYCDEERDEIFVSGRHIDSVFCFSLSSGELKFVLGDPEGWEQEFVDKYFLKADDKSFMWFYEQHGLSPTPEGNLMLFDNGHYRSKNPDKYLLNKDNYSRGVLYALDRRNMKVQELFAYGEERKAAYFSPYICNVEYYEADRYMVHSGGIAYKGDEVLEDLGSVAYLSEDGDQVRLISTTTELYQGREMYEVSFAANMFRAEKLNPYYAQENFKFTQGEILGTMPVSAEIGVEIPATFSTETLPSEYEAELIEEYDRFKFTAKYEKGDLACLRLQDEQGQFHDYFISTSTSETGAMCVGTFLNKDKRIADLYINKAGLAGSYKVFLTVNELCYDLGLTLKV